MIRIHTDGSANNKTGEGGWATIIQVPSILTEITGWTEGTTSNRMEMIAMIEGLKEFETPSEIEIISDSAYIINAIKGHWYERWFKDNRRSKPRPNMDLWLEMSGLLHFHDISFTKVKGHNGDYWNERADKLAAIARKEKKSLRNVLPWDIN